MDTDKKAPLTVEAVVSPSHFEFLTNCSFIERKEDWTFKDVNKSK